MRPPCWVSGDAGQLLSGQWPKQPQQVPRVLGARDVWRVRPGPVGASGAWWKEMGARPAAQPGPWRRRLRVGWVVQAAALSVGPSAGASFPGCRAGRRAGGGHPLWGGVPGSRSALCSSNGDRPLAERWLAGGCSCLLLSVSACTAHLPTCFPTNWLRSPGDGKNSPRARLCSPCSCSPPPPPPCLLGWA